MTHDRQTMIQEAIQAQQILSRAISTSHRQLWIELDLSMAQLKTLFTLYKSGALSIGQIAEILGIGQPTASHLVDRLVQSGFVVRTEDPLDRRRNLAALSEQGTELAERLREVRIAPMQRWLARLDDDALSALCLGLQALAAIAEEEAPPEHS